MRSNKIKAMWREGKPAAAGWLSTGNTYLAEAMAHAGYDAVIIDMQHGMAVTTDKAVACLQAISTTDTVPMVRLPWNDPQVIQFVLDAGAYGVIVPLVNTYDDAVAAGRASRYPPIGDRSFGANRARFYAGADYADHANDEIIVLVMIETLAGGGEPGEDSQSAGHRRLLHRPFRPGRHHGAVARAGCLQEPRASGGLPARSGRGERHRHGSLPPRRGSRPKRPGSLPRGSSSPK